MCQLVPSFLICPTYLFDKQSGVVKLNDDYYRPVLKLKCGQVDVFLTVLSPVFILIGSGNAFFSS
jgi:hypothetical protein